MSLFGAATTTAPATAAAQAQGDTSGDIPLQSPPEDSISDVAFSSQSDHLAVSSWDKKVRIYEIGSDGNSVGKAMYEHDAPVLSVVWSKVYPPPQIKPPSTVPSDAPRTEPSSFPEARTSKQNCSTSRPDRPPK